MRINLQLPHKEFIARPSIQADVPHNYSASINSWQISKLAERIKIHMSTTFP